MIIKKYLQVAVILILVLLSTSCSGPGSITTINITPVSSVDLGLVPPSPESLAEQGYANPDIHRVTAPRLKQMLDNSEPVKIIDTRGPLFFRLGHIPEAMNIYSAGEDADVLLKQLPKDRPLVFYCD